MRRTVILFSVALLLVIVAAFFAFVFSPGNEGGGAERDDRRGFLGSLFPFGGGGGNDDRIGEGDLDGELRVDNRPVPVLREVSSEPTSGGYVYADENGEVMIRYVDRSTGHVFETGANTLSSIRISNTTIPEIQNVVFSDENNFVIQYLNEENEIENFSITLDPDAEEQSIQGDFIRSWERGVAERTSCTLLSVDEGASGSSVFLSAIDGSNERLVLSSPIRSWVPLQSEDGIYLYGAPSSGALGFLYRVSNGSLIKEAPGLRGLVAIVSESGRYVFASGGDGDGRLILFDTETNESYSGILQSIASKCVFVSEDPVQITCGVPLEMPPGNYPEDWLLGRAQFEDDIWMIEPIEGVATLLAVPTDDVSRIIDVWKPMIDPSGSYLSFINKRDLSFWTLRLKEEPEEIN